MFAPKIYTQDIKANQTLIRRLRLEKLRDVRALVQRYVPESRLTSKHRDFVEALMDGASS